MSKIRFFLLYLLSTTSSLAGDLCCPQPTDFKWVMPASAVVAVGAGAIAGYGAGTRIQRSRITPAAQEVLHGGIFIERELFWISPTNDDPTGPVIQAEIFDPTGELYAFSLLGRGMAPQYISPLGTEDNPSLTGQYRVVYTVVIEGDAPSHLGGISLQGSPLFTPVVNASPTIPVGTQAILLFSYPGGNL